MLTLFLILLALVWLSVSVLVVASCRMAAHGEGELGEETREAQSPRRPSTWGTVRSRILTSPQSDQLATYR
jgi:hypothetical protein